eukprot:evm.model.scf_158.3 EVM.evm.TU.scf_158.3   scf_158:21217-34323(-)
MGTIAAASVGFLPTYLIALLASLATPSAGQAGVNFQPAPAGSTPACPSPISDFAELHEAVACVGDGCADGPCDSVSLEDHDAFAYGPPEAGVQLLVLRDVAVTAAAHVLWKMGYDDGEEAAVKVQQGVTLSLKNITVEADPTVSTEAFLLPTDLNLAGAGSALVLESVTLLTSKDIVLEVMQFAEDNLFRRDYSVTKLPSGEKAVIIKEYAVAGVTAREVTVSHWEFPEEVGGESQRGQGISDPTRLVLALRKWDVVLSDSLNILEDTALNESQFLGADGLNLSQIVVDRNVSLVGQRAKHAMFEKIPLLDLGLVTGALSVEGRATMTFKNLELLNLALGPEDLHYGFLMWFLDFDRMLNRTRVIISDSTLVVSCREMEHLRYAIALVNDPRQTLLQQLPNLTSFNSSDWNISAYEEVVVERGKAFGLELKNVNLTCRPSHGNLLDVDFILDSPLVAPSSNEPTPSPPNFRTSDATSSSSSVGTGSLLFKVGLGVLVPCIAVLGGLLVWKCHSSMKLNQSRHNMPKNGSAMQLKDCDIEGDAGVPKPRAKGKKTMKRSPSNLFVEDNLDQLPARSNDGPLRDKPGQNSLKLMPVAVSGSQAAEFIPDILKVSNDIDDKQLVVKELLGQGQHGSVHKGVWRELDVAVKTIVFCGESNKDFHQQAIREVAITSGLAHPNVVCTYSYDIKRLQAGSLEGRMGPLKNKSDINILDSYVDWKLFIIQEYCEQGTLKAALKDRLFVQTEVPDSKCLLEISMGIAKGMHHIHSKNILHGNLKPSNVLLKTAPDMHSKMVAKVADFGLSLKMSSEQTHVSNVQQGEPFYMAREVMEEGSASKAADIYAFGVVLWEMYMSQLSSNGEPTEEMYSIFPRFPYCCPGMYGVLATACMHPVPSARPKFSDCLSFLQTLWHQQRLGALTPNSAAALRERIGGCHEGQVPGSAKLDWRCAGSQDPEFQQALKKKRAQFQKSLAMMPSIFRSIQYEAVYWSEMQSMSQSAND